MNNIDELIERLVIAKNRLVELDEEAKDRDDNAAITLAITALREQQERIAELEKFEWEKPAVKRYLERVERQRDAAIQLAEDCCAMSVSNCWIYLMMASDEEIERIRGMK